MNQAILVPTVPVFVPPGILDVSVLNVVNVPRTCIVSLQEGVCVTQPVQTVQNQVFRSMTTMDNKFLWPFVLNLVI